MNNAIDIFFGKEFENIINIELLENDYEFPTEKVLEYVRSIIEIDIRSYFNWLDDNFSTTMIDVQDAVQYSSFEDVVYNVSKKIIIAGDSGLSYLQIGKILQDDGKVRKDGAYTKYGENHAKTASYLGYLFSLKKTYYVSSIGYIIDELSLKEQGKLYARLFIRTNLFKTVYYLTKSGEVNLRKVFDMLSEKTYIRRRSNIKMLFQKLVEVEPECAEIINKIIY